MRLVIWMDDEGYKRRSLVRDNDPDSLAPAGVPCDPPDLDRLDWDELKRQLHNILVDRGLSTWEEVMVSQNGVTSSIVSVMKGPIIGLYRTQFVEDDNDN
jgi:hypothetical protein